MGTRPKLDLEKICKSLPTVNEELNEKYGEEGTFEREQFEAEALDFYASQIILQSRKECNVTQKELAERSGIDKTYISRIENGLVQPSFSTFVKIIRALGRSVEVV